MLDTLRRADNTAQEAIAEEMRIRQTSEVFLLFPLGSQFDHLIRQALETLGVYCLVADPASVTVDDVLRINPIGIILSGGPASVWLDPPPFDTAIFDLGIPILGICLGFQLWAKHIGVPVASADRREFGMHELDVVDEDGLLRGCGPKTPVLESHGDRIEPDRRLTILGMTENAPVAAARCRNLWGVQFHPEVTHTSHGLTMLANFCFEVCGARDRYPAERVAERKIADLARAIAGKRVLLALSGGSDSSTIAYLLKQAMGPGTRIRAVYIVGTDRPDDARRVQEFFGNQPWLDLKPVDATERFLAAVRGKAGMHEKRLAMRDVYRTVLEDEIRAFGADFIVQGTLYTDISESGGGYQSGARKARIKLHHNVDLEFSVPELLPLADCVKDNGRSIGRTVGVPEPLLTAHPFPGPGLLIRVEGEVDATKLAIARQADAILMAELRAWQLYDTVWQAGAVVTQSVHTCTKGDDAAEGVVVAIWAVWSVNGFTAQWADLPSDFLRHVSRRITNEVREAGGVAHFISDKPPATIEWG